MLKFAFEDTNELEPVLRAVGIKPLIAGDVIRHVAPVIPVKADRYIPFRNVGVGDVLSYSMLLLVRDMKHIENGIATPLKTINAAVSHSAFKRTMIIAPGSLRSERGVTDGTRLGQLAIPSLCQSAIGTLDRAIKLILPRRYKRLSAVKTSLLNGCLFQRLSVALQGTVIRGVRSVVIELSLHRLPTNSALTSYPCSFLSRLAHRSKATRFRAKTIGRIPVMVCLKGHFAMFAIEGRFRHFIPHIERGL